MENSKESGGCGKPAEINPSPSPNPDESAAVEVASAVDGAATPPRRPFTALSQVDADLALARVLQEQERAYMMLQMGVDGSDYSSEGSYYEEEDDEDAAHPDHLQGEEDPNSVQRDQERAVEGGDEMDGSDYEEEEEEIEVGEFEDDEAFARALQDAEEREVAFRLMALAGLSEWVNKFCLKNAYVAKEGPSSGFSLNG